MLLWRPKYFFSERDVPNLVSQMVLTQGALDQEAQLLRRHLSFIPGIPWRGTAIEGLATMRWGLVSSTWPLRTHLSTCRHFLLHSINVTSSKSSSCLITILLGHGKWTPCPKGIWAPDSDFQEPTLCCGRTREGYLCWNMTSSQLFQAHKPRPVGVRAQPFIVKGEQKPAWGLSAPISPVLKQLQIGRVGVFKAASEIKSQ